jgi:arabinogalactan endo-1,4-beta-galactosidase
MLRLLIAFSLLTGWACQPQVPPPPPESALPIRGADLSFLPQLEAKGIRYFDETGQQGDALSLLQQKGLNTVRLRLWHQPESGHSSLEEVRVFAERIRSQGLKLWLCLHYSDSWADPGKQWPPRAWEGLPFNLLQDSVRAYTRRVVGQLRPSYVQIGNEINTGLLWPQGDRFQQPEQFRQLLEAGLTGARAASDTAQLMIHYAGKKASLDFFTPLASLDYDLIGLSYYPFFHGNDLDSLQSCMQDLRDAFGKPVVIAETAYPFTLQWQDHTHNLLGLEEQLILPDFPATPQGQKAFLARLRQLILDAKGLGFCYWAAEWVTTEDCPADSGSSWENQAVFDFEHRLLPVGEAWRE